MTYGKRVAFVLIGLFLLSGIICVVFNWAEVRTNFGSPADIRASYELLRSDLAISGMKSWRMRLEPTHNTGPKEWFVTEAIIPDREHTWQREDHGPRVGNLEYIRVGDNRYYKGDAMPDHAASLEWTKLTPRVTPPAGYYFELRFHLTNPRTIGYSFDRIETSMWSNYSGLHLRPGGVRNYSGHECRDWNFSWVNEETGENFTDSVCLGTRDHLPYHLTAGGGWAEATYEWNPAISVEEPSAAHSQPKGFISALPEE
jgi:hypothetical protein